MILETVQRKAPIKSEGGISEQKPSGEPFEDSGGCTMRRVQKAQLQDQRETRTWERDAQPTRRDHTTLK